MSERRGDFIVTFTGRQFWPLDPDPNEINEVDVAHALSNLCRFTGHVSSFYSIAEHCCHVHDAAQPENKLWGLLHDAAEAYLGDVARPTKHAMVGFGPAYEVAERRVMRAVKERFGLEGDQPEEIHLLDNRVLENERMALMPDVLGRSWTGAKPLRGLQIHAWTPPTAKREFLRRFGRLV